MSHCVDRENPIAREGFSQGIPLVGSDEMQRLEEYVCRRYGIDTLVLMENAGRAVAELVSRLIGQEQKITNVLVLCGSGNNGGDGFVAARHLRLRFPFLPIRIVLVGDPDRLKPDNRTNYLIANAMGIDILVATEPEQVRIDSETLVLDALFGTGVTRPLEGLNLVIIEKVNRQSAMVVAVDVPSGVDASTGRILGTAVKAQYTVTLGMVKRGLTVWPGLSQAGKIVRASIGIPFNRDELPEWPHDELISPASIAHCLPVRRPDAHKMTAGVVGICAGSEGLLGAGILAARGALGCGCGMVVWALPSLLASQVKPVFPELVTFWPVSERLNRPFYYRPGLVKAIIDFFTGKKCASLVLGPGLGTRPGTALFLDKLINHAPCAGVIDADALTLIARDREYWKGKLTGWVLTPHAGEMARLVGCSVIEVNHNRLSVARETAAFYGGTVILKGPGTLIVSPEGDVSVNVTGNPGLATAGSGDVLSGAVASLMAQGLDPLQSSRAGVVLHGLAGDVLTRKGYAMFQAGELAEYLREAIRVTRHGEWTTSIMDGY